MFPLIFKATNGSVTVASSEVTSALSVVVYLNTASKSPSLGSKVNLLGSAFNIGTLSTTAVPS